jgi:hypothetical protein
VVPDNSRETYTFRPAPEHVNAYVMLIVDDGLPVSCSSHHPPHALGYACGCISYAVMQRAMLYTITMHLSTSVIFSTLQIAFNTNGDPQLHPMQSDHTSWLSPETFVVEHTTCQSHNPPSCLRSKQASITTCPRLLRWPSTFPAILVNM